LVAKVAKVVHLLAPQRSFQQHVEAKVAKEESAGLLTTSIVRAAGPAGQGGMVVTELTDKTVP
jgi:hypothetical protein